MVIAPGSVMKEPSKGPMMRMASHQAAGDSLPKRAKKPRQPSEAKHRAGRGQRHDDHYEERLGEVHSHHISLHRREIVEGQHRREQHEDPDAEDGFHFAEEMEDGALEAHHVVGLGLVHLLADARIMIVLDLVGEFRDRDGHEGVEDRKDEDDRGDEQEGLLFGAVGELGADALDSRRGFLLREGGHFLDECRRLQPVGVRRRCQAREQQGEEDEKESR